MAEIATFLVEHFGFAAVILVLGVIADYVSTARLKADVVTWIRSGKLAISLQRVLTTFLDGFVYRLFSSRLFSVKFFVRSSLISTVFLSLILLLQAIWGRPALGQFEDIGPTFGISCVVLCIFLVINLIIDYVSNVQTIIFLRMAANSGRLVDAIVAFYADVVLTVAIFTFLFPIGLIVCSLAIASFPTSTTFELEQLGMSQFSGAYANQTKNPDPTIPKNANGYDFEVHIASEDISTRPRVRMYVKVYASGTTAATALFTESMTSHLPGSRVLEQSATTTKIEVRVPKSKDAHRFLIDYYYNAYRSSNITRDYFIELVKLRSYVIPPSHILQLISPGKAVTFFKCTDGRLLQQNSEQAVVDDQCDIASSMTLRIVEGFSAPEIIIAPYLDLFAFPVTPFAMTSFAASVLYYSAIFMSVIGISIFQLLKRVTTLPMLDFESKPFTIVSVFAFPVFFLLAALARVISH
jgi:hypothetical protein